MTDKCPMDDVPMPPKAESALAKLRWAAHVFSVIEPRNSFERVSYSAAINDLQSAIHALNNFDDQLRAERIAAYELGRNAGQEVVQRERESFKAFLREMHADHNDQHNHFGWALNEWVRRTEATQGETK